MSSLQRTMSIFSPESSRTMFFTRMPRMPTQAPTGSTFSSWERTAILVRKPGSRAMPLISTMPSAISETSSSKSRRTKSGWLRERMIAGPWASFCTLST